jgi:hypothetical protein
VQVVDAAFILNYTYVSNPTLVFEDGKMTTLHSDIPEALRGFRGKLIPTNVRGAYAVAARDDEFDPNTASQRELIDHGIFLRRPEKGANPRLRAAWASVFTRRWKSADRIIPKFETRRNKIHVPRGLRKIDDSTFNSDNWAGCAIVGNWGNVWGTWTVPSVAQPAATPAGEDNGWDSSSWVGIDGFDADGSTSTDVLQAGINQDVDRYGKASYLAWYEWYVPQVAGKQYPDYVYEQFVSGFPVNAGDTVAVTVTYLNTDPGTIGLGAGKQQNYGGISMVNYSSGSQFSIVLEPPSGATFNGDSIEWIMERPSFSDGNLAQWPQWGAVNFSLAGGCTPGNFAGEPSTGIIVNCVPFGQANALATATATWDTVGIQQSS